MTPEKTNALQKVNLGILRKYAVVLVLLLLVLLFSLVNPQFFSARNFSNIVTQNTYFIIVAIGLAFVLISGGIDLSVGYQMSLVGIIMAMMMTTWALPVWLALVAGLALGTFLGLINGLIVTRIRTFPLIVTLATSVVFQGVSYIVSKAGTYRNYPQSFQDITKLRWLGVPLDVYLAIVIIIIVSVVFYQTKIGTRVVALGGNEEALRLSGINTKRFKMLIYTTCGFFTAIATIVMVSKANSMQPSFGPGTEFTALTAAIVGGVSFLGGEGNIPALVAGVFVLAVLGNGMQLAGWSTYAQFIVRGLILLGAVAFDEYQKNLRLKTKHR
jgi:ribose/xylose/arabinose/galactoside ABC-type transport system permease subunit